MSNTDEGVIEGAVPVTTETQDEAQAQMPYWQGRYMELREKHNDLVARLRSRAEGAGICLHIIAAFEGFAKGVAHVPSLMLLEALKGTLEQMSERSPLISDRDRE